MIEFSNPRVVIVTPTLKTLEVALTKTGISKTTVSANVLFYGSDILYPSAQQYNGTKILVVWQAGEQGKKTVSIPLEPTANEQEYVLATIDDALGDSIGAVSRAYILLSKVAVTGNIDNKFLPNTLGNYVGLVTRTATGFNSQYVKESDLAVRNFTPNTQTSAGTGGTVPAPPIGSNPLVLTDKGWSSTPSVLTAPLGDNDLTVANTQFVARELAAINQKVIPPFTPNTQTTGGLGGLVPAPPAGLDPLLLTNKGWSSSPQVLTAPLGDADLTVANTQFVARGLAAIDNKFFVTFASGTQTVAGSSGLVPSPPAGSDPLVLTDKGWRSSPQVLTAPLGDNDLTVANTQFVARGLSAIDEKFSLPFTSSGEDSAGKPGLVPSPPEGLDPLILTSKGWNSKPEVLTAPEGDADLTVANTQFVTRGLEWINQKFSELTKVFIANSATVAGKSGIVPAPPASEETLVLTNEGWSESVTISLVQPGMGIEWYGLDLPDGGWLWQDGSFYDPEMYPNLFTVIGYSRGRSGDKFKVPDRRGRVGVGAGLGDGLTDRIPGEQGGLERVVLNISQTPEHIHPIDENPHVHATTEDQHIHLATAEPHNHPLYDPTHKHNGFLDANGNMVPYVTTEYNSSNPGAGGITPNSTAPDVVSTINSYTGITIDPVNVSISIGGAKTNLSINPASSNIRVLPQGNNQSHENMPPFEVVSYIIKY